MARFAERQLPPINPEWENRGYLGRTIQSLPLQGATGAASFAHMKWLLDPRRPNPMNASRNLALNQELYKLRPDGVKLKYHMNTKWWQQANPIFPMEGSHYNPLTKTAQVSSKFKTIGGVDPGIAAHELGHAKQFASKKTAPKLLNMAQTPSRLALSFGLIPQMFIDDEEIAGKFAAGATALSAPTLIHEIDASRRGRDLLKTAAKKSGTKLGFLKSLAPYKGVPSYMLAAALPLLYHRYISKRGGYKKKGQIKVNKKWGY